MIRRGRRNSFRTLLRWLMFGAIVYGGFYVYSQMFVFNPDEILEKSILRENKFETKIEEVVSPRHKIKAYLYEDKTNPIISMSFLFKNAGKAAEDVDKLGISTLAEEVLLSGAGVWSDDVLKEKLEDNAISISFSSEKDDFFGSLMTTKENSALAYDMLKAILTVPHLKENDLERAKRRLQEVLRLQQEHPKKVLALEFAKKIYGEHPYARNPFGKKETIEKLSSNDLRDFIKKCFAKNNLLIGVAGDISADELGIVLDDIYGALPEKANLNFVRKADINFMAKTEDIQLTTAQNIAMFAVEGVTRKHKDFYSLYIANFIFGGAGLNSRLSIAARENEGLTYSIGTALQLYDKASLVTGSFSSTPENFDKVIKILQNEWDLFANKGVSLKEFDEAKKYLIASYNLRFASIANIADIMLHIQKSDLGIDFLQKRNEYVNNVSLEQINEAAKKYFDSKKIIRVNIVNHKNNNEEHK